MWLWLGRLLLLGLLAVDWAFDPAPLVSFSPPMSSTEVVPSWDADRAASQQRIAADRKIVPADSPGAAISSLPRPFLTLSLAVARTPRPLTGLIYLLMTLLR
jgi:hypothetical protein